MNSAGIVMAGKFAFVPIRKAAEPHRTLFGGGTSSQLVFVSQHAAKKS
jgi:hypothetical protein